MRNKRRNNGGGDRVRQGEGRVRAKKHLGQHFLKDLGIAQRIVDALQPAAMHLSKQCASSTPPPPAAGEIQLAHGQDTSPSAGGVLDSTLHTLEVGPGMGVLTQFLLQRPDINLTVAEIDGESVQYLKSHYPTLRIIEGDFLHMNLEELLPATTAKTTETASSKELHIIGNFPYNISSQIFFKVLEHRDIVPQVVGMVQREVATRIAEQAGSRDYGILSVLLQAWYDIEYLFTVSEGVFDPPPKVKSAVIRLTRNSRTELGCDEKLFRQTVKGAFGQRRKMLRNALRAAFELPEGADHRFMNMRAEQLTIENFIELTIWIAKNKQETRQ